MYLSKSRYCGWWQCPKMAWLQRYRPETRTEDGDALSRMKTGAEVGELARGLFGPYTDVTTLKDDRPDIPAMIAVTQEEMAKQTPVICEASFSYNSLYCAVDILKQENGGWAIYEVKSSTPPGKRGVSG